MRKIVAAINVTLDGFCDHTAGIADDETHQNYTNLLLNSGTMLFGRITYELMESYWPTVVAKPTGIPSMDNFAAAIDNIPKIVFSRTMKNIGWKTATLAKGGIKEEVLELRQRPGKDILIASRSLIVALLNLNLIDELQLCVHPVILRNGLTPLLENISDKIDMKLLRTKAFRCGAIVLYYEPIRKGQ